ncbi:hypothetical protein [Hymenobacter sp. B1770]|uniref:hypothetical protein n=1 Tax=Hymenobacter sp. B1770 TaxID=1718788 RepID=UPI003CF107B5
MTDRKPDDLYDALRDRLADYGQEPPAQLWAGIRAQLPPPVAQPQLRKRRRWSPVLLLGLLLAVVSGAGWQWWRTAGPGQTTLGQGELATHSTPPGTKTPSTSNPSEAARQLPAYSAATASQSTESSRITDSEIVGTLPGKAAYTPEGGAIARTTPAAEAVTGMPSAASISSAASSGSVATRHTAPTAHGRVLSTARQSATGLSARSGIANGSALTRKQTRSGPDVLPTGLESAAASQAGMPDQPTSAGSDYPAGQSQAVNEIAVSSAQPGLPPTPGAEAQPTGTAAIAPSGAPAARTSELANHEIAAGNNSQLLMRSVVPVLEEASPRPALRLNADTLSDTPEIPVRRWAAQVLAGPSLTYRRLGQQAALASSPYVTPSAFSRFLNNSAPNQLAQEEKPSAGYGLQVQAHRVLNGRWSFSTGLGYQEYATQTPYSYNPTLSAMGFGTSVNPSSPASIVPTQLTHRDTYRFLTVPLRLGYGLGQGRSSRLYYGVLAGADAAFYVGGKSTGADTSPRTWSSSGAPYRSLNISLSAGLDLRYRATSRVELLAQPTATYFVNSLMKSDSGLTPRYLMGTGVLFGLSYELR